MSESPTPSTTAASNGRARRVLPDGIIADGVLLTVCVYFGYLTLQMREVERRAPILVISVMIALMLWEVLKKLIGAARGSTADGTVEKWPIGYELIHVAAFGAFGALVYTIGYRLAVPVFLVAFLAAMRVRLIMIIAVAGGMSLFVYIVFSEIFNVR